MANILITSGPTRQYLDPIRYLTNASSGKMGRELAIAAVNAGHQVTVISGPVAVKYPEKATVIDIVTTDELLETCKREFEKCDVLIGAAAPCDYRPVKIAEQKIKKTGEPILLQLVETPDVVAMLGATKRPDQWTIGFALETEDAHFRAITKLQKKNCDLIVLNGPQAIDSENNSIKIIAADGNIVSQDDGPKQQIAVTIMQTIAANLLRKF